MTGETVEKALGEEQHLIFVVSNAKFALPTMRIKEVLEYWRPTHVPDGRDFIHGVINLRGNVVPVISLASKVGLSVEEVTPRTCIVTVEVMLAEEPVVIGVVVDKVLQVRNIPLTDIETPAKIGNKIRLDFINGMGRIKDGFVVILDIDKILSADELAIATDPMARPGVVKTETHGSVTDNISSSRE